MSALTLDSRVHRSDEPVFAQIDTELLLLSVEQGKYFHLNRVAANAWELLTQPMRVTEICDSLRSRYDITEDECQRDVLDFLRELHSRALIAVVE